MVGGVSCVGLVVGDNGLAGVGGVGRMVCGGGPFVAVAK